MKKNNSICVIDDDEIYQFIVRKEIESINLTHKIIAFSNGEEALKFFQSIENFNNLPDIILLDVNMPIVDGWQFLVEYALIKQKLPKKILIYMVTSSVNDRDIKKAKLISEVSDYIIKPVAKEKLREIIENLSA